VKHKKLISGVLLLFAVLFCLPCVSAAVGTLTVTLRYADDDGKKIPVAGAGLRVVRVAAATDSGYEPVEALRKAGFSAADMVEGAPRDTTERVARETLSKGLPYLSAVTDKQGKASFAISDRGVYLVMQTSRKGTAVDFEYISPYFVEISSVGTVFRSVETYPKTEKVSAARIDDPIRDTSKTSPKTGGDAAPAVASILSGIALLLSVWYHKSVKEDGRYGRKERS